MTVPNAGTVSIADITFFVLRTGSPFLKVLTDSAGFGQTTGNG